MESDLQHNLHQNKQQMNSSGLTRYQSAPSSCFANFMGDVESLVHPPQPLSPQTDRILAQLMMSDPSPSHDQNSQFLKQEETEDIQMIYQNPSQLTLPPDQESLATASMVSPYGPVNNVSQMKMGGGKINNQNNSNLIRHSSSPAGLFSELNIENGYVTMRSMGNLQVVSEETSYHPTTRGLKNQINLSPRKQSFSSSSSGFTAEVGNKNMEGHIPSFGELGGDEDIGDYFPVGSWENSATVPQNFGGLKRSRDDHIVDGDGNKFSSLNASDTQQGELSRNRVPAAVLSHHLSLPKSSKEMMSAMEKFLEFQDSAVPCKIRAKRGCATHPRSIAERVRRTRISERMRKLQDLVPNMDKQTNTSDMLDLAVDYIKGLQKQVKTLVGNRAKCTCSGN